MSMYGHNGGMTTQPALSPPEADVCCPSLTVSSLSLDEAQDFARILKSVADPTRLRLVSLIAGHESAQQQTQRHGGNDPHRQETVQRRHLRRHWRIVAGNSRGMHGLP